VEFELIRFNPKRKARGVAAAEVKTTDTDGRVLFLWMSQRDIVLNIKEFGSHPGLDAAKQAYRRNKTFPEDDAPALVGAS